MAKHNVVGFVFGSLLIIVSSIAMAEPIHVDLCLTVKHSPGQKLTLIGESNLPDGTLLGGPVHCDATLYDESKEDGVAIKDGKFEIGSFGPLKPGEYDAWVFFLYPEQQPGSVRAIIGKRGENLQGPLVERDDDFGCSIEMRQSFNMGTKGVLPAGK